MKSRLVQFLVLSILLFIVPISSHAQFNVNFNDLNMGNFSVDSFANSGFGASELGIELSPTNPQPGDEVEATINDYSSALYGSAITWVLDGEVITNAANQRTITFTAPAAGESMVIEVALNTSNGETHNLSTAVSPVYLDIILEPQTRVPDFYQGRALPSIGSVINATALVDDGSGVRTTDLVYTWKVGQQVIQNGPLRGGYKVSFPMPQGDEAVLSLRVTEFDGTVVGNRAVLVRSVMPEITFYEVSALYGPKEIAIDENYAVVGNTATVRAEPYHLDSRVFNDPDITEWKLNNQSTSNVGSNPYEVTLQRSGVTGTSQLQFHVRDTSQVLQGARGNLNLSF